MSVRAHYDSLYSLLKAQLPTSYQVYKWDVPAKPAYPYVLLWGGLGRETGEALCDTPDLLNLRPKITYAGATGDSVLAVVDRVRDVLRDRVLTVPGWSPTRLKQTSLIDAQPDHQVTLEGTALHPVFGVDEFPFTSQRA